MQDIYLSYKSDKFEGRKLPQNRKKNKSDHGIVDNRFHDRLWSPLPYKECGSRDHIISQYVKIMTHDSWLILQYDKVDFANRQKPQKRNASQFMTVTA